jgi:hypothetical protein
LSGFVNYSTNTTVIQWKLYSGPGTVTFGNASQTNTTATFSAGGTYTLMLSADDSVHSVAYDAVVFTVTPGIALTMSRVGTNLALNWSGTSATYTLEKSPSLPATSWQTVLTTNGQSARIPMTGASGFFRVRGQ